MGQPMKVKHCRCPTNHYTVGYWSYRSEE